MPRTRRRTLSGVRPLDGIHDRPTRSRHLRGGVRAVLDGFGGDDRRTFDDAYCATYRAFAPLIEELYDEVRSGNEITSVRLAAQRLERRPMADIDGSRMWAVGDEIRATTQRDRRRRSIPSPPASSAAQ